MPVGVCEFDSHLPHKRITARLSSFFIYRGADSPEPLGSLRSLGALNQDFKSPQTDILERWASGLNRRSRKPLNDSVVPGVRISFSPQTVEAQRVALGFFGARDTLSLLISGPCAKKAQEPQAHELQPVCKGPRGERKEKRHARQRVANLLPAKQLSPRRAEGEKAHAPACG